MAKINAGDPFPEIGASTVDGRNLRLPADLDGDYAVLLFYRGWW